MPVATMYDRDPARLSWDCPALSADVARLILLPPAGPCYHANTRAIGPDGDGAVQVCGELLISVLGRGETAYPVR